MASKKTHSAAPGSSMSGGVTSTMNAPFSRGSDMGSQKNMEDGAFPQGRTGGDNGLPTRVTDPVGGPSKGGTGLAIGISSPGPILADRKK